MEDQHWNDSEFLELIYGLRQPDEHLARCPDCGSWRDRFVARRRSILAEPEISGQYLAAQRRRILARLEQPRQTWSWKLAPAMAAVAVLMAALLLQGPAQAPVQQARLTDAQLFTEAVSMATSSAPRPLYIASSAGTEKGLYEDAYSLAFSSEPQAAKPLRALFEVQQ
jgi:predicted anti-sigma-YlaC factor YlaD